MDFKLDHFKFYDIDHYQIGKTVELQGQFDEFPLKAYVALASHFGNPVNKNDEGIKNRNHHLTAYRIHCDPEPVRIVELENQFGPQTLRIETPELLLVPTYKIEPTQVPPEDLGHYKCYRVLDGKPINKDVQLKDQFDLQGALVTQPLYFCVPVEKRHGDEVHKIFNPDDHLTIYDISPKPYDLGRSVKDQFRKAEIKILRSTMLAVPTKKLHFKVG